MTEEQWEEVEVPKGQYVSWGRPGQEITGKVIGYAPMGGTDFNGAPCPQLSLETVAPFTNYSDQGTKSFQVPAGELVVINAGQANLKRTIVAAQVALGDLVKLSYAEDVRQQGKPGAVKVFAMKVARGSGRTSAPATPIGQDQGYTPAVQLPPQPAQAAQGWAPSSDAPPF